MTLLTDSNRIIRPDLVLFHGGRIDGPVELRTRSKSMAYGPGFYMTTSYWTAREYRGGNGFVYKVRVSGNMRWAHQVRVDMHTVGRFLDAIPKLKNRKKVLDNLWQYSMRQNESKVSFVAIMNTLDIHQSYGAKVARDVAQALVDFGVDATLVTGQGGGLEDWVVLHNMAKVRSVEKTTGPEADAPRMKEES